jgi:hypothetical protein
VEESPWEITNLLAVIMCSFPSKKDSFIPFYFQ